MAARWIRTMAMVGGVGAAAACSSAASLSGNTGNAETGRHNQSVVPTLEESLQLLTPYNYVFDIGGTGSPCVGWTNAGGNHVQVSGLTTTVSMNYITGLDSLVTQLGFDATLGAKVDPVAASQLAASYSNTFTKSDNKYTYLLSIAQTYDVLAAAPVQMASQPADPYAFLRACGDSYVAGLRYGGSLNILMTIDAATQTDANKVAAGITASATAPIQGVPVTGNLDAGVTSSSTTTTSGLTVTFTMQATGFNPGASLTSLTTSDPNTIASTVSSLSSYMGTLSASITTDRSNDASGNGTNPGRLAVPVDVIRGFYTDTAGFDTSHNPFAVLNPQITNATIFLNYFSYLNTELEGVYYDEIQAFLNADPGSKAKFNLAPPSAPLSTEQQVAAVVAQSEPIFRPTNGSGLLAGNVTSGVRSRLYQCFESATAIDANGQTTYAGCTGNAQTQPEFTAAMAALDSYSAQSRVLPVHFYSDGDHAYGGSCSDLASTLGFTPVEPDYQQVVALGPAIGADPDQCAWFNASSAPSADQCSIVASAYYDGSKYACSSDVRFSGCALFCVPPGGVFGTISALGSGNPLPPPSSTDSGESATVTGPSPSPASASDAGTSPSANDAAIMATSDPAVPSSDDAGPANDDAGWADAAPDAGPTQPPGDDAAAADAAPSDPCAGASDGTYCGGDGVTGDSSTLYQCSGGMLQSATPCTSGCQTMGGATDSCE